MKILKAMLYSMCAVVITLSAWNLWKIQQSENDTTELYTSLSKQVYHLEEQQEATTGNDVMSGEQVQIVNPWITELKKQNRELIAWLRIPNTIIDYPVMQTKEDNDYYLTHSFDMNQDRHGTPFVDVRCRVGKSENVIIYGHHMKDGTMFQNLMLYKDAEFCKNNENIQLFTAEETFSYKVICVILIGEREMEAFPYFNYIDFQDAERFHEFWEKCGEYAVWKTEGPVVYGNALLTLSTCEYSKGNGRLVVIAQMELAETSS